MVKAFAKLNCFFSFSASILHIPKHAAALKAVPEERLLLETDSPDQLPRSLRGGVAPNGEEVLADDKGQALNEPCWLPLVLEAAAMHRQVPEVQLAEVTARNAERLFRRGFLHGERVFGGLRWVQGPQLGVRNLGHSKASLGCAWA
ncbi:3'-5' ssDNA/RNA exonuclease TatD (DNase TatD) [Durusdinium trenchii]|uniref:3'-5' ssDNA/RNA exonuclease TatD (DNase TatD) n=1 Tax=Durusdinium trenchii TaxID=1381693 RepID=A0ABP0KL59_9DINO